MRHRGWRITSRKLHYLITLFIKHQWEYDSYLYIFPLFWVKWSTLHQWGHESCDASLFFFVLAWWELCWETGNEGESWGLTWKCSHKQTKRKIFNNKTKLFIIIAPGLFIFLFWGQRIISENWSYVFISWLVCLIYCAHFRFYVFFLWAFVQALSSLIVWTNFIWSSLLAEL